MFLRDFPSGCRVSQQIHAQAHDVARDGSAHSPFDRERLRHFGDLDPYPMAFLVADRGQLLGFLAGHARGFRAMAITERFRVDFYGLI
jgi:hypothetical protein